MKLRGVGLMLCIFAVWAAPVGLLASEPSPYWQRCAIAAIVVWTPALFVGLTTRLLTRLYPHWKVGAAIGAVFFRGATTILGMLLSLKFLAVCAEEKTGFALWIIGFYLPTLAMETASLYIEFSGDEPDRTKA